jgi:hypothetical protein
MRWVEHVVRLGERINSYRTEVENLKRRDHLEVVGIYGRIYGRI